MWVVDHRVQAMLGVPNIFQSHMVRRHNISYLCIK